MQLMGRYTECLIHACNVQQCQTTRSQSEGSKGKGKNKAPQGPVVLDENTVYMEDFDRPPPITPEKDKSKVDPTSSSPSKKKARWHDYDPYRLPEVDMDAAVAKATRSSAPDPRLATEDELRAFIEMMRPEDLDIRSPAFRELPTEVQYEIIGDLRLKSRQTSHSRLTAMLMNSRTALDFSKAQIQGLKQRNALTQQLLETTDSIGKAHVSIPIRIASERNREYVLVKNEGADGGWILGIRDEGTMDKPIEIDQDDENGKVEESDEGEEVDDSDDDMDMEEVVMYVLPILYYKFQSCIVLLSAPVLLNLILICVNIDAGSLSMAWLNVEQQQLEKGDRQSRRRSQLKLPKNWYQSHSLYLSLMKMK